MLSVQYLTIGGVTPYIRVRQEVGGQAALARNRGYHRRNTSSSSLLRTFVTTRLYDRRDKKITRNIVERSSI